MGLRNLIAKRDQTQNSLGQPLAGGSIFLYEPGTTTFIQAFQNAELTIPHAVPIKLSGSGRANIWINRDCDVRIEDRNANLILTEANANPDTLGDAPVGGFVANGGFETDTDADGTPDSWTLVNEAGSTNARDTSESTEGGASFRFTSAGTGGGNLTTTSFFPVNDVDDLRVNFDIRSTVAAVRNIVRVEWYDITQISISDTDVYDSVTNPTSFLGQSTAATPPANARFAKLKLIGIDPSVALAGSTFFDMVEVFYPVEILGIFDNITIQNNEIITTDTDGDLDLNPNGTGEVNITAPLNVTGALNVNNVTIQNNEIITTDTDGDLTLNPDGTGSVNMASPDMTVGEAGANFGIIHVADDQSIILSGGISEILGANIVLDGGTSPSTGDMSFRNDANTWMQWDETAGELLLNTGIGAKTLALTVDVNQVVDFVNPPTTDGIVFPATQVPVANVNTLDDYEEGEGAVTLSSGGGSITINTGFDTLAHTKIGDLCHVQGSISVTSVSAPTGTITLNGLPFTSATLTEGADFNRFTVTVTNLTTSADGPFQGFIQPGNTTLVIQGFDSAALAAEVQAGTVFNFSFSYKTA